MIDVNELRLGNWVYDSDRTKFPMYVETIGTDYVYLNFNGNEGDIWEATPEDLQGIPLTKELMERMGFKRNEVGLWEKEEKRRQILVHLEREFVFIEAFEKRLMDSRGWCHGIKHLHQLQNLFRCISKENLEVVL